MREDQIEEVNAAANRYEDAHRHAVDHHVFNNELSGGEHEHADEGGSGNQVGVAVGGEHLPRDIGCDETQKGERSHQSRCNGDAERNPHHQTAQRRFVVNAEADGLFPAETDDIENGQIAAQPPGEQGKQHNAWDNAGSIHVGKARHERIEERIVFIRIHDAGERVLHAREECREHCADQQHVQNISAGLLKDRVVDEARRRPHHDDVDREGIDRVSGKFAPGSQEEHHAGMDEQVEGVHAEKARRDNVVADDRLENDGCRRNGRAGRQQHNQARQTDAHGIAEKLRIHEGKLVERSKKNHETDEAA